VKQSKQGVKQSNLGVKQSNQREREAWDAW
jgi:hypothetical protein